MEETHTAKGKMKARTDDANFILGADFGKQSTVWWEIYGGAMEV